jgi:hypothetical protein
MTGQDRMSPALRASGPARRSAASRRGSQRGPHGHEGIAPLPSAELCGSGGSAVNGLDCAEDHRRGTLRRADYGTGTLGRTGLGGQRVPVLSCSYRARVISLNQGPATSIRSLPSDAWAVAATWARAVCGLASSRHHWALGLKSAGGGVVKKPFGFAVVTWTVHQFSLVVVWVVPGQGHGVYIE